MGKPLQPAALNWNKPAGCVRLLLAGDVMTGRAIDQLFATHNPDDFGKPGNAPAARYRAWSSALHGEEHRPVRHDYIWGSALGALDRAQPDFRLVNLETAITTCGDWADKTFTFRMHPANVDCLSTAAIDCCALANNHLMDFGRQGLADTLETLSRAGIGYAGAGSNIDTATQPWIQRLPSGGRVLVFSWAARDSGVPESWQAKPDRAGVNYLPDLSSATLSRMAALINTTRMPDDLVIVSIHWGGNWVQTIPETHRWLARSLIEHAGVDVIHGHSSHHPLGVEVHRQRLILYGCGDLINDYEGHPKYRRMRPHLGALYIADVDAHTGILRGLRIIPVQRRRFRLENPSREDSAWLNRLIRHQSQPDASKQADAGHG